MTSAASSSTRQGARPESCLRVRAVRASNNRVSQTVRASTGREAGSRVGAETREMEVWEDLRRQARTLEGDIDQKLIAFNRLSVSWEQANGRGDEERDNLLHKGEHVSATLAAELDSYLFQLTEANEGMGRCLREMGSTAESARLMHVLQRHRELLHEYEKECRKIKTNIREQRERDELLHSVRRDIGEFKSAAASRTDSLVRERASATNSLRTTDQLLRGAAATYESLKNQRQLYNSITVKLSSFRSRLPSIDQLIGRIQRRKKTESIILALVIASCAITIIYFSILR